MSLVQWTDAVYGILPVLSSGFDFDEAIGSIAFSFVIVRPTWLS